MTKRRITGAALLALCTIAAASAMLIGTRTVGNASAAWVIGIAIGAIAIRARAFVSKTAAFPGSARTAFVGFLVLSGIALAIAELAVTQIIGPTSATRGGGIVIGAMAILTGNFLPKTRALGADLSSGPRTRAVERAIGWILVLAGVAFVILFAVAPLERAKSVAAAAGIGAMVLIAATSARLVVEALRHRRLTAGASIEQAPQTTYSRPPPMTAPLVAFSCVFTTACVHYLFAGESHGHAIAAWVTTLASASVLMVYAVLTLRGKLLR